MWRACRANQRARIPLICEEGQNYCDKKEQKLNPEIHLWKKKTQREEKGIEKENSHQEKRQWNDNKKVISILENDDPEEINYGQLQQVRRIPNETHHDEHLRGVSDHQDTSESKVIVILPDCRFCFIISAIDRIISTVGAIFTLFSELLAVSVYVQIQCFLSNPSAEVRSPKKNRMSDSEHQRCDKLGILTFAMSSSLFYTSWIQRDV
jgi:hypothetical protein